MIANTGMTTGEVVTEIERYIVMPGQACAYKIGMLKILELREKQNEILEFVPFTRISQCGLKKRSSPFKYFRRYCGLLYKRKKR